MKRREVLRMAPLAAAGAAAGGAIRGLLWPGPKDAPIRARSGVAAVEVKPHNGSPALFLDGQVVPSDRIAGDSADSIHFSPDSRLLIIPIVRPIGVPWASKLYDIQEGRFLNSGEAVEDYCLGPEGKPPPHGAQDPVGHE